MKLTPEQQALLDSTLGPAVTSRALQLTTALGEPAFFRAPERSVEENLRLIHAVQRALPTLAATRGVETLGRSDVGRLRALIGYAQDALVGSDYGYALDASQEVK